MTETPPREKAFFFRSQGKRLFGFVHEPDQGWEENRPAVLFCHTHPVEQHIAHRGLVNYGRMLATQGYLVLRFDLFGTGDSEGEPHEASLNHWLGDISCAVGWLRENYGVTNLGALGLRLGASLLALTAERRSEEFGFLVLWSPITSGRAHLARLLRLEALARMRRGNSLQEAGGEQNLRQDGEVEVMGIRMSQAQRQELQSLDLGQAKLYSGPVLIVHFSNNKSDEVDLAKLASSYPHADLRKVPDWPLWVSYNMWHFHANAPRLYEQTSAWLSQTMAGVVQDGRGSLLHA